MESFKIYADYAEQLELLSNNQCGVLFRALIDYVNGKEAPAMDSITQMAFLFIKGNIEREKKEIQRIKEEEERENAELSKLRSQWGKLGGRPKKVKKGNLSDEKVTFSEKSIPFDTFSEKEVPKTEKERSKEKEYNPQEKYIPPYNPPKAETDGDETDETIKGYLEFMREHPYIIEDLNNPSELYGIDFSLLAQKIAQSSRCLQSKQSLKWLIGHYREIIGDSYKDFYRNGEPPDIPTGKGDLQLWREVVNALEIAKEERWCENAGRRMELFRMADEEAKREMGELYKGLSPEISAYFEPNSFLDLCKMDEGELKFERARFLKALGGIRQKLAKEKANG